MPIGWTRKKHDYSDFEGLLINGGVITALILSFSVLLIFTFDRDDFLWRDMWLAFQEPGFPKFALQVLELQTDFNFQIPVGLKGENMPESEFFETYEGTDLVFFDLRTYLQKYGEPGHESTETCVLGTCTIAEKEIAINELTEHFPKDIFRSWRELHIMNVFTGKGSSHASLILNVLSIATLCPALFGFVFQYISLSISAAREDESGKTLRAFNIWGGFAGLVLSYLLLVAGTVLFFAGLSQTVQSVSPDSRLANFPWAYDFFTDTLPLTLILLLFSVLAFLRTLMHFQKIQVVASASGDEPRKGPASLQRSLGSAPHHSGSQDNLKLIEKQSAEALGVSALEKGDPSMNEAHPKQVPAFPLKPNNEAPASQGTFQRGVDVAVSQMIDSEDRASSGRGLEVD